MKRMICEWTGPAIKGRAVTVFHFAPGASDIGTPVFNFFNSIKDTFQAGTKIVVPNSGDMIDEATGQLLGEWHEDGPLRTASSAGPGQSAAGVGAVITWRTGGIANGHRVKGRTFLVPLGANAYDGDGTITDTTLNGLRAAADGLVNSTLVIWHRPRTKGGSDGSSHQVLQANVKDKVAVLRSRRD